MNNKGTNMNHMDNSLAKHGRLGDTEIREVNGEPSHVNILEALIIDTQGKEGEKLVSKKGSGSINPKTGMREYFDPFTMAMIALFSAGGLRVAGGSDWDPRTRGYSPTSGTKMKDFDVTNFGDVMNLMSGKMGDKGNLLKDLKYFRGGHEGTQRKGWGNLTADSSLFNFNPLKMVSEKLKPEIQKNTFERRGFGLKIAENLKKLFGKKDVGGPTVGKTDIFGKGASEASQLEQKTSAFDKNLLSDKREESLKTFIDMI
jgi:hypothetical protein